MATVGNVVNVNVNAVEEMLYGRHWPIGQCHTDSLKAIPRLNVILQLY